MCNREQTMDPVIVRRASPDPDKGGAQGLQNSGERCSGSIKDDLGCPHAQHEVKGAHITIESASLGLGRPHWK